MQAELALLFDNQNLRAIDKAFARFIQLYVDENSPVIALAMLVSFELGKGNVCVELSTLNKAALFGLNKTESLALVTWLSLDDAASFDKLLNTSAVVSDGSQATPLVFDGKRLYLHRYWQAEQLVAKQILARAKEVALPPHAAELLDALFLSRDDNQIDWQKIAAASAISYGFSVISGGPGTGKTTTVVKLLAALLQTSRSALSIKLVAPTGKAANRLTQSIGNALLTLNVDPKIKARIPTQASTIHRLLGVIPQSVSYRHNEENPLHLDVLVVDEASMVDLAMMAKLLSALPAKARIILLGDKDQLSSVEAGAVLGDICAFSKLGFSQSRAKKLQALTGFSLDSHSGENAVADAVSLLRKSYRFNEKSGIGLLANAINAGDVKKVQAVWQQGFSDIAFYELNEKGYEHAIKQAALGYGRYLDAIKKGQSHQSIVEAFNQFRLLCVLNEGDFGLSGLNLAIENQLIKTKKIVVGEEKFYVGRPIIIKQNEHGLGIYNGDIGIVVELNEERRVIFEMADGSIKAFLPSRLPLHQTAFAMTVHKSQGSEFEYTMMMLPPKLNPVITKELIYTGVTRAKKRLDIYAQEAILYQAIRRKTERASGLSDVLTS